MWSIGSYTGNCVDLMRLPSNTVYRFHFGNKIWIILNYLFCAYGPLVYTWNLPFHAYQKNSSLRSKQNLSYIALRLVWVCWNMHRYIKLVPDAGKVWIFSTFQSCTELVFYRSSTHVAKFYIELTMCHNLVKFSTAVLSRKNEFSTEVLVSFEYSFLP